MYMIEIHVHMIYVHGTCTMKNRKSNETVLETYCETDFIAEILKRDTKPMTGLDKTNFNSNFRVGVKTQKLSVIKR